MITDGDTVPETGMPKMPAAVVHKLIVGVGDPHQGTFIDGRHSRQDASTLRQIAIRLGGIYHDGNAKHVSSDVISAISQSGGKEDLSRLTKREYALMATSVGAFLLAFLPLALQQWGTRWRPGTATLGGPLPPAGRSHRRRKRQSADLEPIGSGAAN